MENKLIPAAARNWAAAETQRSRLRDCHGMGECNNNIIWTVDVSKGNIMSLYVGGHGPI